jgi:hypothetical protein
MKSFSVTIASFWWLYITALVTWLIVVNRRRLIAAEEREHVSGIPRSTLRTGTLLAVIAVCIFRYSNG